MAVRWFESPEQIVMTVKLKTGETFEGCDLSQNPFGEHDRVVAVWIGDKIRVFPMGDVEFCEMYETDPSS